MMRKEKWRKEKKKKNNEVRKARETLLQLDVRSSAFLLLHSGDLR